MGLEGVSNKTDSKSQNSESATLPANVVSILKTINDAAAAATQESNTDSKLKQNTSKTSTTSGSNSKQKLPVKIPRGKAKSGRPWKTPKQKFSSIKKSIYRDTKAKKDVLRQEIKHIKDLSRSIKADRKQENVMKKERREENARKRLENERKSEVVQIIKNPAKLKRMKKKALRKIEKRDLNTLKVV